MTFGEDSRHQGSGGDESGALKARKACSLCCPCQRSWHSMLIIEILVNCRKQKMKCIVQGNSESCRRCRRAGLPCVFVPRANAAQLPLVSEPLDLEFKNNILSRLKIVEDRLGLVGDNSMSFEMFAGAQEQSPEPTNEPLWNAILQLQRCSPSLPSSIWRRDTVESLWSSYVTYSSLSSSTG
jgi:hypothetical protein